MEKDSTCLLATYVHLLLFRPPDVSQRPYILILSFFITHVLMLRLVEWTLHQK